MSFRFPLLFSLSLFIFPFISQSQNRPNVIIILADDLDDYVSPQFFPEVLPFLDTLKKEGINFTNSFVPMSVCCPSRAGLLSGKYGHKTNVLNNGGDYGGRAQFIDDEPHTLPAYLQKAGYRTTMIGKYLNGFHVKGGNLPSVPFGWTDGVVHVSGKARPYKGYNYKLMNWQNGKSLNDSVWQADRTSEKRGHREEDYSTDLFTREAIKFLNETEKDDKQPFFMFLCPTAPHWPLEPAPRHKTKTFDRWANSPVPVQPNTFNDKGKLTYADEGDFPSDKPWWIRRTWNKRINQKNKGAGLYNTAWGRKTPKNIKSYMNADWYHRMGSLYALNDMVREVVNTLKANGEWENTVLIFTSDNGYQFGNHGLYQKATPYEESIRVPLVISGGAAIHLKNQKEISEWVTNLDLMPTILKLSGVPVPADVDGLALNEWITVGNEKPSELRDKVVLEYNGPGLAGYLTKSYRLHFFRLPSYLMDLPTYRALRMKVNINKAGVETEKVYKYIEWEKHPGMFTFRRKLNQKDPSLMQKINAGDKKTLKKLEKANAVETELYNITDDRYELDNLYYYKYAETKRISDMMKNEVHKIIGK